MINKNVTVWKGGVHNRMFLFMLLFLSVVFTVVAQDTSDLKVTGIVTSSADGIPLPGVTIIDLNDPSNGVISDFDGKFEIVVSSGSTSLKFSYIGFKTIEVPVNNNSTLNVSLDEDVSNLDEVVIVGYGTQKKVTVTGAVVSVKGESLKTSPAVDVSNSLAGRLPGVVAIQASGEPGADGASVSIRGTNTLGDNSPLIVIDGIPDRAGGLGRLSPQDIESISVLKDASAAIYGARAANGAILITTKRGKSGKPTITYDSSFGFSNPTILPELANAFEYASIINELPIFQNIPVNEWGAASTAINTNGTYTSPTAGVGTINATYSPTAVQAFADGSDPLRYPNTDWFDEVFKSNSPQSRHNFQITGGNENVKYMSSLGYLSQDAFYKNSATKYKQYSFRTNLDVKINEYIKVNTGVLVRREDRTYPTQDAGAIFRMIMRGRPTEPAVWANGLPGPDIENGQNPVVITTNATGYDDQITDYVQLNGGIEITNPWVEGLKLTLSAAVDNSNFRGKKWETPWELYTWDGVSFEADGTSPLLEGNIRSNFTDARLTQISRNTLDTNLSATLNYDRTFGEDHTISLLAGVTRETKTGDFFSSFRRNFLSDAVDQLFAGGATQEVDGSGFEQARLGYFGRMQYNYKEKYLAEFIWRYDGSYIFPESQRFGFFPGVLVGWNISNEDFFNVEAIDYLKLRASYGELGNDRVFFNGQLQEFAYLATYGFGEFPINGIVETTLLETVLANENFTWERANNFNIGLDGTILNGKIDFTLEYFYNKRDQILIQNLGSTPESSGIVDLLPPVNAGRVDNRGFEYRIDYRGSSESGLRYTFGINGGYAKNEVVFMDEIPGAPTYQLQEGRSIGGYLVYESDGAFLDAAEVASNTIDYSGVTNELKPGDMKFKDINGDGVINGDDQVRLDDNGIPTFNFGASINLEYKNFDLSMLFQGATGSSIRIETESGDIGNYLKYSFDNRWSVDNPSSVHPRLASRGDTYYTGGNFGNNTYFLFDKDYVRLKNIQIGYNFPKDMIEDLGISGFRVYASGANLFTIAKNKIFDPEATAGNGVYYPQSKIINTGFSITF